MELKECSTCHVLYPLDAFYKNGNNKGGRAHKCSTCSKEYSRVHRIKHHYKYYAYKYSTTPEQIKQVLDRVVCDICKAQPKPTKRNFIDHCHVTGKVRGLLCDDCNMGIGRFKDSTELLDKAKEYLEQRK